MLFFFLCKMHSLLCNFSLKMLDIHQKTGIIFVDIGCVCRNSFGSSNCFFFAVVFVHRRQVVYNVKMDLFVWRTWIDFQWPYSHVKPCYDMRVSNLFMSLPICRVLPVNQLPPRVAIVFLSTTDQQTEYKLIKFRLHKTLVIM